ncbi:MAG: FkbM family methyltransferase [Sideroxyarcus sp.]|nr:FkbM family methyltransferase [Sideroxyarcus sp.]
MINKIILSLYQILPPKMRNGIGQSVFLKPIRDFFLRPKGSFRETKVLVNRDYLVYKVNFYFFASMKTASKAAKNGIENTLLRNSINLLKKHKSVENDAVILDVGANFGFLSLVWANSISQNGKVIAFEPNISVHNSFKKAIRVNNLESTIQLKNLAVGNNDGSIELFLSSTTSNIMQIGMQPNNKTNIEMVSLDSFSKRNDIVRCDLVKIDVDGIELDILMGATNLLENCKPIFIVETNSDKRIIDFFQKHEYQILDMELNPFQSGEQLPPNIFCIPKTN